MLQDATAVRASIPSRLRVFATQDDTVDLKLAAVDPIVKIARWGALSATSTSICCCARRLDTFRGAVELPVLLGVVPIEDVSGLTERVSLSALAPADRAALRTVAREVSGIRRKLAFLASTSSFR